MREVNQKQKEQSIVKFPKKSTTKKQIPTITPKSQCTWRTSPPMNTTFEVSYPIKWSKHLFSISKIRQLYETLPFDNSDGGVWTQGFDIQYNTSQWTSKKKLKIILMPHSHCDPGKSPTQIYSYCIWLGWLNTYEQYFLHATKYILNTMMKILDQNRKYKFIWAEMSFLSLWWDQATKTQRTLLKKLISNQQFEIVTGGWVSEEKISRFDLIAFIR